MRNFTKILLTGTLLSAVALIGGCSKDNTTPAQQQLGSADHVKSESKRINEWFAARYQENLARSPLSQTYLGLKDAASNKVDDASQAALDEEYAMEQQWATDMKREFNFERLDRQGKISYRLFDYTAKISKLDHAFENHQYVFNHMGGAHTEFPTFMVNFHTVETSKDMWNYIARLKEAPRYLGQYRARTQAQYDDGIKLPKFVYAKLINASKNVITGAPFDEGADSPLFADMKSKIEALDISPGAKNKLIDVARSELLNSVKPAYEDLITMFKTQETSADKQDGAWKLPDGAAYYKTRLEHYTTTNLTADEIHNIGLKEVARIQGEMQKIMTKLGFEGNLQDFYNFLRTDKQFTFSNDDAGRATYMSEAKQVVDDMKGKLDDLFITKPKADMIVKRVEPFREASAFGAFYEQPSVDGSRPGTYFINLRDVREQPKYLMQALAYHEGIPGHHMQIAISMELDGIPEFRKQGGYTAYIEGWALYAESVPAELGLYTDPYSDFGRLSMEIFRAARLVVDTGIHSKKWTREQAVQYMLKNIANPEGDIRAEIDRYIVWPGQATAYKIGMLKIGELKKSAKTTLGDKFDIREFHDVILANGSVPLSILEELVNEWADSK